MSVDVRRRCAISKVKMWKNSDELTTIRWWFAPPDSRFIPTSHRFLSKCYMYDFQHPDPVDGQVGHCQRRTRFDRGERPIFVIKSKVPCGDLHVWKNGATLGVDQPLTYTSWNIPRCCIENAFKIDGHLNFWTDFGGDVSISAEAANLHVHYAPKAAGTIVVDADAEVSVSRAYSPEVDATVILDADADVEVFSPLVYEPDVSATVVIGSVTEINVGIPTTYVPGVEATVVVDAAYSNDETDAAIVVVDGEHSNDATDAAIVVVDAEAEFS